MVVLKYGGHAMADPELQRAFAEDVVFLHYAGLRPVIVHGGGPQITAHLDRLGISSEFRAGLRVTTPETMQVVRMVLVGQVNGDVVRLVNDRGACLAGARVTDGVMAGVVQLPTGAWFDPVDPEADPPFCAHGNPNVLTRDIGTSALAQGCTGQHTAVQVERWTGPVPPVRAHEPPPIGS